MANLCDGCGCEVELVEDLVECPDCLDMVGDCCWDEFEGLCVFCVDARDCTLY